MFRTILIAGALAVAGHAEAQPRNVLAPQLILTSDYRFNGLSSRSNKPALQGSLYLWRPDGLYAGIFASQVDYGFPGTPSYEIDLYGGKNLDLGKTRLTGEVMGYDLSDNRSGAFELDFIQVSAKARRSAGPWSFGGAASWTPSASAGAGEAWSVKADAALKVTSNLTLGATAGRWIPERGQERTFWEAGATLAFKRVEFDLRYADTDLSRAECFYTSWCEPAVVGKVTFNAPYILLGR